MAIPRACIVQLNASPVDLAEYAYANSGEVQDAEFGHANRLMRFVLLSSEVGLLRNPVARKCRFVLSQLYSFYSLKEF